MTDRFKFFRELTNNWDNRAENALVSNGRPVLVDNEFAFNIEHKNNDFTSAVSKALTQDANPEQFQAFFPTREVYDKLVNTQLSDWKAKMNYLSEDQFSLFWNARQRIINDIELVKSIYGDNVFFPSELAGNVNIQVVKRTG